MLVRPIRRCTDSMLVVLSIGQLGCTSVPPADADAAVVQVENSWTFPYVLLDFASVDLFIREVDGKCCFHGSVELTPGEHSLTVEAWKGPNGYLGVAPFRGICRGTLKVNASAGAAYSVVFKRDEGSEELHFLDKETRAVLAHAPCSSRQSTR